MTQIMKGVRAKRLVLSMLLSLLLGGCMRVLPNPFTTLPALAPTATPYALVDAPIVLPPPPGAIDDTAITMVTWNVGMNDADQPTIAAQIAAFDGVEIWTLQEVSGWKVAEVLAAAAGMGENARFTAVQGTTGANIPLLTLYDDDRFDLLGWHELHEINFTGTVRAPLVLHLVDGVTGIEFLVLNNHLYRSQEDDRDLQATLLNQWARTQRLPMLAGGDYNFDYTIPNGPLPADRGFDNMTADGVWQWLEPDVLVNTQCSGTLPCRYRDVLDFIFAAGDARDWLAESTIIVRAGDFPDDTLKSDHRPVGVVIIPE